MRQERSRLFLSLGEAGNWHGPQVNPTSSAMLEAPVPRHRLPSGLRKLAKREARRGGSGQSMGGAWGGVAYQDRGAIRWGDECECPLSMASLASWQPRQRQAVGWASRRSTEISRPHFAQVP